VKARLNDIDRNVWLAVVLFRIVDPPQNRLRELLQSHWAAKTEHRKVAA
jgi:hypothetical protein